MTDKKFKVKTGLDLPAPLPADQGGTGQTSLSNLLNALLPAQSGHANKMLMTDGTNTTWTTVTAPYTPMTSIAVSSNITISSNNKYFVDTTSARTLTLPSSPALGDEIYIFDASNNSLTNNITVLPNGNKLNGAIDSLIIDSNGAAVYLAYTGSAFGWDVN
jgi:hypothetical protein